MQQLIMNQKIMHGKKITTLRFGNRVTEIIRTMPKHNIQHKDVMHDLGLERAD